MEVAVQTNERRLAELQRRHAADRKQSSKQLKKDYRNRREAFCEQLEMRKAGIIGEHERLRLRQVCATIQYPFTNIELYCQTYMHSGLCLSK